MTVRELITHLQTLPPDTRVMVRGYEGGVHDVGGAEAGAIRENYHRGSQYYGPHEWYDTRENAEADYRIDAEYLSTPDYPVVDAIKITGDPNTPRTA